ncbi:MAG: hypothetical protein ACREMA_20410, partial [Longimicrobiales bacterium]
MFESKRAVTRGAVLAILLAACGDDPIDPGNGTGFIEIDSDPRGAAIFVDGQDRGKVTPDTLHGLSGLREITVRIDSAGATYGYRVQVRTGADSVIRLMGPLTLSRCNQQCPLVTEHTVS